MKHPDAQHYIGGTFQSGGTTRLDIHQPATGAVLSEVTLGDAATVDAAVRAAEAAFPAWSALPIKERVQVFYRYRELLQRHLRELSALITEEHGKLAAEADAEILKAIE
ncbi:MAG TPA: aldehyde dehydrogenase family protein, partial [Gemmatimonadales bacterium]|nr:aldehyde dehydrogenase family protein [Gemmatimonadales bacterium]